jgi:hypothetical protein
VLAIALSVAVEVHALAMGRWSYTAAAPKLPFAGVSLLPILQLIVLLPISFALAREATARVTRKRDERQSTGCGRSSGGAV